MLARAGILTLALLAAPAAPAAALPAPDDLWATVNVCDSARHANEVGVRASMPARPRGAARRMRFRLQWRDGERWRYVDGADSGWRTLTRRAVESGWTFEVAPRRRPITFRGVVRYRWVVDGVVVRRAREVTESGHRSTAGADPTSYSAASCSIA
jgi:hypothetical protein